MQVLYRLKNNKNNMYYIGSTSDFEFRMFTHEKYSYCNFKKLHKVLYDDIKKFGITSFTVEILYECEDIVECSRIESKVVRENVGDPLMYNVMPGASGRRVFYESDIVFIRNLYQSKSIYITDAYNLYYKDIVTFRAFKKAWHGDTFRDIRYEVYTPENKGFHFAKGQSRVGEVNGRSKYSTEDVLSIRRRRDNGEQIKDVYLEYKDRSTYHCFYEIWSNKSWKHLL